MIQFLLKSATTANGASNLPVLIERYEDITGWQDVPALAAPDPVHSRRPVAVRAGQLPCGHRPPIPQARAHVVAGTGHWVHAEKPEAVLRAIHRFLDEA